MEFETIGEFEGTPVREAVLNTSTGGRVHVMTYGASIRDWRVNVGRESRRVVLGYDQFEPYIKDESYLGAIIGRVANRIGGARFTLNGKTYAVESGGKPYQLHGGPKGIGRRNWRLESVDKNEIVMTCQSPAGEMGFPGDAAFKVTYSIDGEKLRILMEAEVSEPTPVSLVQHGYFNLAGQGKVLDHKVKVNAAAYTPLDQNLVPTGEIRPVDGTVYDLRKARTMRDTSGVPVPYDINLVLDPQRDLLSPVAEVEAADGSMELKLWTDQPGLQVYNSIHLDYTALCLEDQMFPDAVNRPEFPPVIAIPGRPYRHECTIEIRAK